MAIFVVDASAALAWCFEDEASSWGDRLTDRKLERITSLVNFPRERGTSAAPWSGVSPDGFPLLLRNTGTQEI